MQYENDLKYLRRRKHIANIGLSYNVLRFCVLLKKKKKIEQNYVTFIIFVRLFLKFRPLCGATVGDGFCTASSQRRINSILSSTGFDHTYLSHSQTNYCSDTTENTYNVWKIVF